MSVPARRIVGDQQFRAQRTRCAPRRLGARRAGGHARPGRRRYPSGSAPSGTGVESVHLRVLRDAEPALIPAVRDGVVDHEEWFTAEISVHNSVTSYRVLLSRGVAGYSWLNGTGEYFRDVADHHDFGLTTFDPGPDWALDSVVYQVFPDRFASSRAQRPLPDWALRPGGTTRSSTPGRTPRASPSGEIWTGLPSTRIISSTAAQPCRT